MSTCFLFIKEYPSECVSCVRASETKEPLLVETLAWTEIAAWQKTDKTMIVLTAERCGLFDVALPKLSMAKLRAAIPYALEEKVAQNVSEMHFALDDSAKASRLVVAIDASWFRMLIDALHAANIQFEGVTLDWFALKTNEACLTKTSFLVHDEDFKGALSIDALDVYFKRCAEKPTIYAFKNSMAVDSNLPVVRIQVNDEAWIAERLQEHPWINLCQGVFAPRHQKQTWIFGPYLSALLLGCVLLLLVVNPLIQIHGLNRQLLVLDKEIATIYKDFFPKATEVLQPELQIKQWIRQHAGADEDSFWHVLNQLAHVIELKTMTIKKLNFNDQVFLVSLDAQSFEVLNKLQQDLKKAGLVVKQIQAKLQHGQVVATLELRDET